MALYPFQPPPNPGLAESDFRLTGPSGFGDGLNSYAHSMAWFDGKLYVGTTRALWQANYFNPPRANLKPWPVEPPKDLYDIERRAEIWCYDPRLDQWQRVYRAALVKGRNGKDVARYVGFRGMTVFQGRRDRKPCLYVSTWAPQMAPEPPDILRTEDGVNFNAAPRPPWDVSVRSFRALQTHAGAVHTSPTHSRAANADKAQECVGSDATVYACSDIDSGDWWAASPEGFGDADNLTVFELASFNGQLYAGTVNPKGFDLWRTMDTSTRPYKWKRVLTRGAGRGPFNEVAGTMCVFNGALYVGTGIVNGGFHRLLNIGPAACELLRVYPDDSWEMVMGDPRITPDGYRVPLSGYASGFDKLFNGYIWRMCEHEGWLYAGTFCWSQMLPYLPKQYWPEDVLNQVRRWGEDTLAYGLGGCELWRSADGVRWHNITRNGFGNCYNWGIRNFASTPYGLMVGTANPFGPAVATRRNGEWSYQNNPRGGCEIWRGEHAGKS